MSSYVVPIIHLKDMNLMDSFISSFTKIASAYYSKFDAITNGENGICRVIAVDRNGKAILPCGACREFMIQLMPENYRSIEIKQHTLSHQKELYFSNRKLKFDNPFPSSHQQKARLLAKKWAKQKGAKKLYISAHSAVESQAFYKSMGCVEAEVYNQKHVEDEPYDCQLDQQKARL